MNSLLLFKNNLRVKDNPVLFYGSESGNVLPVYIYDDINTNKKMGSSSKYWLHRALESLNHSLSGNLMCFKGETISVIDKLIKDYSINEIYCEEPFLKNDVILFKKLKEHLKKTKIRLISFNCTLLWEPYLVLKSDSSPYKVFTPFYKKGCLGNLIPPPPLGDVNSINFSEFNNNTKIEDLQLLDSFNWFGKFDDLWDVSENSALNIFDSFLDKSIYNYKEGRDFPSLNFNSKLSPYIRFGMISVNRMWYEVNKLKFDKNIEHFKSELGWREFSYYLLYHFPEMETNNLQSKFNNFDWENSKTKLNAWTKGRTGYPIIDAGMRELWETGYMHNRVRMVVASFLVKNLSIDWRLGEAWFWDCLLDADYASNIAGWQWVAGTGADAAPYFRIFNPILQGEKFDNNGRYTLKYVPELKNIPLKFLQKPWESSIESNYYDPIIDYRKSREDALNKYSRIK
tara:strand:- start:353 stop:1720 length:1368 start_codon:yes stop_codon:yes gene_type:complete